MWSYQQWIVFTEHAKKSKKNSLKKSFRKTIPKWKKLSILINLNWIISASWMKLTFLFQVLSSCCECNVPSSSFYVLWIHFYHSIVKSLFQLKLNEKSFLEWDRMNDEEYCLALVTASYLKIYWYSTLYNKSNKISLSYFFLLFVLHGNGSKLLFEHNNMLFVFWVNSVPSPHIIIFLICLHIIPKHKFVENERTDICFLWKNVNINIYERFHFSLSCKTQ